MQRDLSNSGDQNVSFYVIWSIAVLVLTGYLWPLLSQGDQLVIRIIDNLDSVHAQYVLLASSGEIFGDSSTLIPGILHAVPRASFPTEFNVILWLYVLFDPLHAYIVNELMIHSIAFAGMILLMQRVIDPHAPHREIVIAVTALFFAMVPFWPPGGISVAGQPLALYLFLKIRDHEDKNWTWILLLTIPLYSSIVFAFLFFLTMMVFLLIYDCKQSRGFNRRFLYAIIAMFLVYLLVEYRLTETMLLNIGAIVSHRIEFSLSSEPFLAAYRQAHLLLLDGHTNASALQYDSIILVIITTIPLLVIRQSLTLRSSLVYIIIVISLQPSGLYDLFMTHKFTLAALTFVASFLFLFQRRYIEIRLFGWLFLFMILSTWLYGFWMYQGSAVIKAFFPLLERFNFSRFYVLQPFVWYLLFGISLSFLLKRVRFAFVVLAWVFISQLDHAYNERNFNYPMSPSITYRQFFAPKAFDEIKKMTGTSTVVVLGIHPSIAQMNGLKTLGGYMSNYPLAYKHVFRQTMERELDKSPPYRQWFDNWGSVCYLFSSEIGSPMKYVNEGIIHNLDLNSTALRNLGAKFLISQYNIVDSPHFIMINDLSDINSYDSFWRLKLYMIKD